LQILVARRLTFVQTQQTDCILDMSHIEIGLHDHHSMDPQDYAPLAHNTKSTALEPKSWTRNLVSTVLTISITLLALWGLIDLSRRMIQVVSEAAIYSDKSDCYCGTSLAEAEQLGCVFDQMASAWMPPQCHDERLSSQFDHSGPLDGGRWSYYTDKNGAQELSVQELAELGGKLTHYYTTLQWHLVHCNFIWRMQYLAWTEGSLVVGDRDDTMHHITHCGNLSLVRDPLETIDTSASIVLNSSRHHFWRQEYENYRLSADHEH
jgi:hypothetical protein